MEDSSGRFVHGDGEADGRTVITRAIDVLVTERGCHVEKAAELLRRAAQENHLRPDIQAAIIVDRAYRGARIEIPA